MSLIVVLSGPGGVGKGTIAAALVADDPQLWLSRSWTTRPQRPGESETAYVFVSRADFERNIAEGGFLEWAEVEGNFYGTPWPDPPESHDVLLEIDVQGGAQVLERHPEALCIFVDAPTPAEQKARLEGRGDAEDHVAARMALAGTERTLAEQIQAVPIINDDLKTAIEEVAAVIEQARAAADAG